MRPSSRRRFALSAVISAVLTIAFSTTAQAAQTHSFADEQIAQSYVVSVTNPLSKVNLPSVLLVSSAHIDTSLPDGGGIQAPKGFLYLTLHMSSGPVQRNTSDPNYGSFYSQLTPLPASAFSYVTSPTKSFSATRINPIDQANNPAATTDDGLVDATYYFTVPATNRMGTVTIAPSRTTGTPFTGFSGGSPVELNIGGPTRIRVHLPKQLTVDFATTTPVPISSGSHLYPAALLLIVGLGAVFYLTRRRRGTISPHAAPTNMHGPTHSPTHIAAPTSVPTSTPTSAHIETSAPQITSSLNDVGNERNALMPVDVLSPQLRVKVLGALEFDPPVRGLSDPARSLLCYLAFHRERLMSAGEIQTALWPTSKTTKDVSRNTFHNYVTEARKAVGNNVLPEAARGAGYQLQNIRIDFEEFETLEQASRTGDGPHSIELRVRALAMVREHSFASEVASYFEWVRSEGLESRIVRSVGDLAYRTALDQIRLGDRVGAEVSLRVGMIVTPVSMALWEQLTDLVAARGDPSLLRLHWTQAQSLLNESNVDLLRQRLQE